MLLPSVTTPRVVPRTKVPQDVALGQPVEARSQPALLRAVGRRAQSIQADQCRPEHRARTQAHQPGMRNCRANAVLEPLSETTVGAAKDPTGQHDVDVVARDAETTGDRYGHYGQLVRESVDDATRDTVVRR